MKPSILRKRSVGSRVIERLEAAITEAEAAIGAQLTEEQAARETDAASVPEALRSTYEGLRRRLGGIGAARLEHGSCTGCHLAIPAQELARIAKQPDDALVFDLMSQWAPDEPTRNRILVQNPEMLYGFAKMA